ncbi:hypothetical protein [Streptomyces sp. TR06-5]|uniref:acyl-CoA-like ligand-binding transcription factor n=1 Tax=unclassified Streptomyces TaxID=2593676 RepID=UPI0039A19DF1
MAAGGGKGSGSVDATDQSRELFAGALAARRPEAGALRLRVLAAAALAALTTALTFWVDGEGGDDLPALVDEAFRAPRAQG